MNKNTCLKFIFSLSLVALVFSGNAVAKTAASGPQKPSSDLKAQKGSPLKTVFDLSHAEVFSPVKQGPLHYSDFYEMIRRSGAEVSVNNARIDARSLDRVKTYILAGPSRELKAEEAGALKDFVNKGGNLLVLLHISSPVARLTESFGIIVSNFVIAEGEDIINGQAQDFYVSRFSQHPVTAGLNRIAVFGTWGLMAEKGAAIAASTSDKAWADLNRNRKYEKNEPVQPFGIIAVNDAAGGKVVVVADDAPFANKFIVEADNKKLAENILRWFRE